MAQHWGDKAVINPRFLYGANTLFRTGILRETGGYNSRLRTNYEDMAISETLYDRKFKLLYEPAARCLHLRRDTEDSILSGFWKWYHAKGLLCGDFDSPEGLINRIDKVNFGIYRYRFDLDLDAGRNDFLKLDLLIPWIFSISDLKLAESRGNVSVPEFPAQELLNILPDNLNDYFLKIMPTGKNNSKSNSSWHHKYMEKFADCLKNYNWLLDCQQNIA